MIAGIDFSTMITGLDFSTMIAGIDFSTFAVDIVIIHELDDKYPDWCRLNLEPGIDAFERARNVSQRHWPRHIREVCAVGIEQPQGSPRFVKTLTDLYRVQGECLACIPRDTLVHPIQPSQWRKGAGLPGNATKEQVAEFVHDKFGDHVADWPQDACDAWCIAEATRLSLVD